MPKLRKHRKNLLPVGNPVETDKLNGILTRPSSCGRTVSVL